MVSNLSTIGFDFDDEAAFRATMARLADDASERLATEDGDYAIWRSRTGAELWFHLAPADDDLNERVIIGLTPFFEGRSDIAIEVEQALTRPDDNALEGALSAWVAPDEFGAAAYPIQFDSVDFAAHKGRAMPDIWRARIVGFARELTAHADEAAFAAASQGAEVGFAAQSFIPIGLFQDVEDAGAGAEAAVNGHSQSPDDGGEPALSEAPQSTAVLTGRVAEHHLLVNEETGRSFHWLLVESLAATYDILADPAAVTGDIVVGGTIESSCLMIGRILEE